jgi:autotransporter-associated beta strand protein
VRGPLAALLAIYILILPYGLAHAQDATWLASPGTNNFNTGSNWSTGTVPTGIAFFDTSNTTGLTFSAFTTLGGWTFNAGASAYTFTNGQTLALTGAGISINGGSATITNNHNLYFYNTSTAGSATIANNSGGSLYFNNSSTAGNASITNNLGSLLHFNNSSTAGSATITNNSSNMYFANTSTAGSANITNNQNLTFYDSSTAGNASITNTGLLTFTNTSTAGNATITNNSGGTTRINSSASGGIARFIMNGTGALDISFLSSAGTTAGSIEGSGNVFLGSKTLTIGGNNLSTAFSGVIQDGGWAGGSGGSLTKGGSGALTLTGANTYTGATTVNGGTLSVNGSIASSSLLTVNAGGTVGGTGTLPLTVIASGGTLAPGNSIGTITVNGNLTFNSASTYAVEVSPSNADRTNVTGSATLAGTVNATFASGSYLTQSYTILSAAGGLGGTTFDSLTTNNPNIAASLSYSSTDVLLNLVAALGGGSNLNGNQQNVASAINGFFNNGGTLPPNFVSLFNLTGNNQANALSAASGEAATGAQQGAFQLTNLFLQIMLDPFVNGRGGVGGGPALAFAAEEHGALPPDVALAYAKVLKAPPSTVVAPVFDRRWSAWASGYGGYNETNGDPGVVGSHDLTARVGGGAAGLDYHFSPDTVLGVALAGGGTNWALAQGLGGGRSDAFQAGAYGASRWGPAYLAGAFAFTNHWMSTDRYAPFGDHLTASFDAESYGGRLEGGYRFGMGAFGMTPYAALQAQSFHMPAYAETDVTGGGFALGYNSRTGSDTRSELGGRFDYLVAANADMVFTLHGRAAWAHDWVTDPTLTAVFQTLPGASFIVDGAVPAEDSALVSAGAELRLADGVSLLAKFDGGFADHSQTYAGTGTLRYTW